ncbi:MAG: hypothetical protein IT538_16080 [Variibacter sp.]|nr:hypothetical protein [Variibacter sp.]
MKLFIFKSQKKPDLRAFASDRSGDTLPQQFAPWHATGVVRADMPGPHNLSRETIEEAIATQGFQLWRMKAPATAS